MRRIAYVVAGTSIVLIAFGAALSIGANFADDSDGEERSVESRGNRGTQIAALSSDPNLSINFSLNLSPEEWELDLSPGAPSELEQDDLPQHVEALIVLADGWHTNEQQLLTPYMSPTNVDVAIRREAGALWMEGSNTLQLIRVPFEKNPDSGFYGSAHLDLRPADGTRDTPTGRRFFIPESGSPSLFCDDSPCGVTNEHLDIPVASEEADWFGSDFAPMTRILK